MTDYDPDDEPSEAWPSRLAAARELSVLLGERITARTLEHWKLDPSCPLPHGRASVPRGPLLRWALTQRRKAGRPPRNNPDGDGEETEGEGNLRVRLLEEQVRNLGLKNGVLADETIPSDDVKMAVVRAVNDLRRELTLDIPAAAWAACQGKPVEEATADIRQLLIGALNRFSESASEVVSGG